MTSESNKEILNRRRFLAAGTAGLAAAGAERRTHGRFFAAARRARQDQVGDIGAGDQQHEADSAHQQGQR